MLRQQLSGHGETLMSSVAVSSSTLTEAHEKGAEVLDVVKFGQDLQILGLQTMREIVGYFEQGCDEFLVICNAQSDNDTVIKNQAHKLKGSAGSLWLTELYQLCQQIEKSASPAQAYGRSEIREVMEQAKQCLRQTLEQAAGEQ
ncbi:MAG: Hpt domain-containing protein [Vibrio sp.]